MKCIDEGIGYITRVGVRDELWDESWDELRYKLWYELRDKGRDNVCVEVWKSKSAVNEQINLTKGE